MSYRVLNRDELIKLRKRLNIAFSTADHLFDLEEGSYENLEKGLRTLTFYEDNIIKETNCFDDCGKNLLPARMLINS
jgi:hypothetical protein